MSLFTLVRQFVLSYRARRTQTHGGDNCVSDSETENNEQAEWMAIREAAKRAEQYEDNDSAELRGQQ